MYTASQTTIRPQHEDPSGHAYCLDDSLFLKVNQIVDWSPFALLPSGIVFQGRPTLVVACEGAISAASVNAVYTLCTNLNIFEVELLAIQNEALLPLHLNTLLKYLADSIKRQVSLPVIASKYFGFKLVVYSTKALPDIYKLQRRYSHRSSISGYNLLEEKSEYSYDFQFDDHYELTQIYRPLPAEASESRHSLERPRVDRPQRTPAPRAQVQTSATTRAATAVREEMVEDEHNETEEDDQ
jgi:hypothetical protein